MLEGSVRSIVYLSAVTSKPDPLLSAEEEAEGDARVADADEPSSPGSCATDRGRRTAGLRKVYGRRKARTGEENIDGCMTVW